MAGKTPHQLRVEAFMKKAEQELPATPRLPCGATRQFRASLILEEALETLEGLGFRVILSGQEVRMKDVEFRPTGAPDLVAAVDGCADLSVVTVGTLSACGVSDGAVLEAVDVNNLAKFGPGSYRRADGKWMKPPGHPLPHIRDILLDQGCVEKI